ncbi:MAG: DUF378 domain-containing protein [Sporomusaceae bacterium]|nr:DUF378 domain-containing protein [Sporomusaceae bacterium]
MDRAALALVVVGALNWLMIGLFHYDLLAGILGGTASFFTRAAYTVIGIAGIWALSLLFRKNGPKA